jgi:hypothetical protein
MIIAITVSNNYSDLLPIVYQTNKDFFIHWIFVTEQNDRETVDFLSKKENVTILYHDFKNHRSIFDKGGAIRYAQNYVYERFPHEWYLLIDSDICLAPQFAHFKIFTLPTLDVNLIYGLAERLDFKSLEDLKNNVNYTYYDHKKQILGYFQLYKDKFFYNTSRDASHCDAEFTANFPEKILIGGMPCAHLGYKSHWSGSRVLGSDFKQ